MNIEMAEKIILFLTEQHGVQTFCVCPGGRNAPFLKVLSYAKNLEVLSFFEERSAGFFALGRCKKNHKPCAVLTTSGTAVAEVLPAVIEAYYSHLPLIVISADRPSAFRGSGSPQTIQQPGIFSHYVKHSWDLENTLEFNFSSWDGLTPCHINVCFDEPLIDKETPSETAVKTETAKTQTISAKVEIGSDVKNASHQQTIKNFFLKAQKPLVILSELNKHFKTSVQKLLSETGWPVYAEALSGLRESSMLQSVIIKSGERFLPTLVKNKQIDGVISIGRRPCARFFRDLEKVYANLPVLSISDQKYSGLSRIPSAVNFESFFQWHSNNKTLNTCSSSLKNILQKDIQYYRQLEELIIKYPLSEVSLVRKISKSIAKNSMMFLGNSLPIREWNLTGVYKYAHIKYYANRGANGIDGLISTFLGLCEKGRDNWCLLGDLSCLYDLQGPWILKQMDTNIKYFLIVINNTGGQIFSSLFKEKIFLNSHNLNFKSWAQFWSLNYYCVRQWESLPGLLSPAVVELKPNLKQSYKFNQAYKTLFIKE